jgi:hypothetical protein
MVKDNAKGAARGSGVLDSPLFSSKQTSPCNQECKGKAVQNTSNRGSVSQKASSQIISRKRGYVLQKASSVGIHLRTHFEMCTYCASQKASSVGIHLCAHSEMCTLRVTESFFCGHPLVHTF